MGELIYIRKLFTQDLRDGKQIAFPREPAEKFFNFMYWHEGAQPRQVTFTFIPRDTSLSEYSNQVFTTRLYAAGTKEARMDGEVKAFLRDKLHAEVDEYVECRKRNDNAYTFDFISRKSARASLYEAFCENRSFHTLILPHATEESKTKLLRQLIIYGAPGTGKSHKIDKRTNESNSIRVTFHPDTDYAAFVGAYKPTMESTDNGLLTLKELGTVLQSLKDRGETRPEQKLGAEFWRSFEKLTPADVKSILENESMYAEVMKGVAVGEYLTRVENGGKQIVYSFVPQAFMKAYVEAWRRYTNAGLQGDAKTYYLVIEEINRGNCAQIFGDLFQLLDRADNGFSAYAITPDDDIQKFLETDKDYKLSDIPLTVDIKKTSEDGEKVIATAADIKSGKKLVLPPNLCIWATMNTSDQSLFPIDSAFKRRWEWEYVPIEDANKNWKIDVGGVKYKWWSFLEKINYLIATETSSEDKQLGYFFVKAKDTMIDAETFVSKVVFFLWGDVFKDNLPDEDVFKYTFKKDGKDDKRLIRFADFYHPEPGNTKEEWRNKLLTSFLEALKVEKEPPADNDSGQGSSNANGDDAKADE